MGCGSEDSLLYYLPDPHIVVLTFECFWSEALEVLPYWLRTSELLEFLYFYLALDFTALKISRHAAIAVNPIYIPFSIP